MFLKIALSRKKRRALRRMKRKRPRRPKKRLLRKMETAPMKMRKKALRRQRMKRRTLRRQRMKRRILNEDEENGLESSSEDPVDDSELDDTAELSFFNVLV